MKGLEYRGVSSIDGPLVFIENISDVAFDELVEITSPDGETRLGQVLDVTATTAVVQVFGGTENLSQRDTKTRFLGESLRIPVSKDMLGRVFDGLARPKDGLPAPLTTERRDVNGMPVNPYAREYPRDFIQTSIDLMNTLVRGQKLPIFSGNGLPHNRMAAQIARQAKLLNENVDFAIVFAAMGVKYDVARFFIDSFEKSGVLHNVAMFLSLADDPSVERLITPRSALTLAEYLAFDLGMHVLVIITDMSNYCEALREIATARGEIPSRKGYPGYLYSDLASMYERAGRLRDREGSITQMPILTMPILTDWRLMKDGIGKGRTRADHPHVASQLFAAYSKVKDIRSLASVIGEEELSPVDKQYLKFGVEFENRLISQGEYENRSIEETLAIGWDVLRILPREELLRVSEEELAEYYDQKPAETKKEG